MINRNPRVLKWRAIVAVLFVGATFIAIGSASLFGARLPLNELQSRKGGDANVATV